MDKHRKQARDYLKTIRTVKELNDYLDTLVLTEEEKNVAKDVYIKGLSHTQIALKYNISIEKSKKLIQRVLGKVL